MAAASWSSRRSRPSPVAALTMKVSCAPTRIACSSAVSGRSWSRETRSILLRTSQTGRWREASPVAIWRTSSVAPARLSTISRMRSASSAPVQAALTMARSSLRRGRKMPGVSTRRICAGPRIRTPSTRKRVVCALGLTMESLAPVRRFSRVDLPALGRADDGGEAAAWGDRVMLAAGPAGRQRRRVRRGACCRRCRCPPRRRRSRP